MWLQKKRTKALVATGISGALGLSLLMSAPGQATPEIDAAASSAQNGPSNRAATKISSGNLGGGKTFVLPDASTGKPPYPAPATNTLVAIPGGLAAPAGKSDPAGKYVPQTSCDPKEKAGVTAFKKAVLARYPKTDDWGSSRECADDGISEHLEGRAWDWHADSKDAANFKSAANLLEWLTANNGANAKRLGIMYIGYNHRIWAIYRVSEGWRQLNNSNPHTDHVHFSFTWRGAVKQTSFWKGKTYAEDYGPCRFYAGQPAPIRSTANGTACSNPPSVPSQYSGKPVLWRGTNNSTVKRVQNLLSVSPANGKFGAATQNAVSTFQIARGLPNTGAVDAPTWYALGLSVAPPAVAAPVVVKKYRTLRVGSRGKDVHRLQAKLRMRVKYRTAYFGQQTKRAVKRKQRQLRRKATGYATPSFQKKIGL